MPRYHVRRALLLALASCTALLAFAMPALASASTYGELGRFGGSGTSPGKFRLDENTQAFGVDPENNDIYVADEPEEESERYRIQQLSSTGAPLASVEIEPTCGNECSIEGIAFDMVKGERRIYLLTGYQRATTAKIDPNALAAGTLYAFSTTPKEGKLQPAAGTTKGVLVTPAGFSAESEAQGVSLLEPKGITVDPSTHDVIVLGKKDVGKNEHGTAEERLSLQRINPEGTLGARYVDPERDINEKFNSPVVTPKGQVLVEEAGEAIVQIPSNFEAKEPKLVFRLPEKEKVIKWGEVGQKDGGGLTLGPEVGGAGTIYANAAVLTNPPFPNPAVLALHYESHGEEVTLSELGWIGGKSESEAGKHCLISEKVEEVGPEEQGTLLDRLVAAGQPGTVFVLDPDPNSEQEVIEFSEAGDPKECPKAGATEPEAMIEGVKATKVHAGKEVTLSSTVKGANALSVQWIFKDGTEEEQTVNGDEHQKTVVKHVFQTAGTATIVEKIHVDNLASPVLEETTKLEVIGASGQEAPKVKKNPEPRTVTEGESAAFEAEATGTPAPTVQWEVSTNTGASWSNVPGATSDKLTLAGTSASQSGSEYRASFSNGVEPKAVTSAAKLTVTKKEAPKVTKGPEPRTVTEGESAAFEAAATGSPTPTVQWEVSSNKGVSWGNVAGATSSKLTISGTSASQSGAEYRASFSNGVEPKATTGAAKLTVNQKPPSGGGSNNNNGGSSGGGGGGGGGNVGAVSTNPGTGVLGVTTKVVPPVPAASLAGTSLAVAKSGALTLKITCPAGETSCTGTVTLRTAAAVSARAASAKKSILTLAAGSFTVAGGQSKSIVLHLSSKARALLAKTHMVRARATIAAHDPHGGAYTRQMIVTLRPAKHH
jgi:hypothetical protein